MDEYTDLFEKQNAALEALRVRVSDARVLAQVDALLDGEGVAGLDPVDRVTNLAQRSRLALALVDELRKDVGRLTAQLRERGGAS